MIFSYSVGMLPREIVSPNYPYGYPNDLDLNTKIGLEFDQIVKLRVIEFYIQNEECRNGSCRISSNNFRIPQDACLTSRFIPAASKVALLRSRSGLISDRPRWKRVKWYRCSSSRITPWNIQTNLKQSSRLNQKSIKKVRQKDQITTTSRCRRMIL